MAKTNPLPWFKDNFTRGYVICALWSSNDESNAQGGDPMDKNYAPADIAKATAQRMRADCEKFQAENAELLARAYKLYATASDGSTPQDCAGHDFWLTRNGHGAGFWDRTELEVDDIGDKLTEAAKKYGQCDLYIHRRKVHMD